MYCVCALMLQRINWSKQWFRQVTEHIAPALCDLVVAYLGDFLSDAVLKRFTVHKPDALKPTVSFQ